MEPVDFEVPSKYRHWVGDPAEDHMGPFFYCVDDDQTETAFRVKPQHCNGHGSVHGGILMSFADYTLCIAAVGRSNEGCLTVSCNNEFVASSKSGDLIVGKSEVIRRTGSLVFVRCLLSVDNKIILMSSGVIKRLIPK